jgi:hypothetical protein
MNPVLRHEPHCNRETYGTALRIEIAKFRRMVSYGMLRRVALVRTDVSEELSASFIRVTRIDELGTTRAATRNRRTLRRNTWLVVPACVVPGSPILVTLMEALGSSETSVLTRATHCNIPEDTILHSHRRENLKTYIAKFRLQGKDTIL